jgi:hypothetical protein
MDKDEIIKKLKKELEHLFPAVSGTNWNTWFTKALEEMYDAGWSNGYRSGEMDATE